MDIIIDHILDYKYVYIISISVLLLILILSIVLKPKKVKPIEVTIDDEPKDKTEIEKVIEALEENKNERVMTSFEEEQEANAIISYQELVKAVEEKRLHLEPKKPQTDENLSSVVESIIEPTIEQEVQINLEEDVTTEPVLEIEEPLVQPEKSQPKFKNSEFISPIFGKDNNNDKFLKDLKDFRNNL